MSSLIVPRSLIELLIVVILLLAVSICAYKEGLLTSVFPVSATSLSAKAAISYTAVSNVFIFGAVIASPALQSCLL